ncbi:MAG: BBP7 family outer membrane beta-barrel protein [Thermoguttaceae bacterium]
MIRDTNWTALHTVAMLGIIGLGFWASPAVAQLAPWQQPPGSSFSPAAGKPDQTPFDPLHATPGEGNLASSGTPSLDTSENSSSPWAREDYEQDGGPLGLGRGYLPNLACELVHDRFWVRSEFLAWWTKGFATPPLLTTSPAGTDSSQAGVLGAPGTSVLLGGKDLQGGFHPGVRFDLGAWLNARQTVGIESSYLQLSRQTEFFNTSGVSVPILARPFFNSETGQQDSQIINYPGQQSGTFSSASSTDLQVAEVLVRKNLNHQPGFAFDIVAGYRYQQLEDHLAVNDTLTFSGTQSSYPAGSIVQQSDGFDTRNVFQGGEVGTSTTLHFQRWSIDTLLKIAVGQTHSRVTIEGTTATTIPGQTATLLPGGLLALPSNMGIHDSNQFSLVPELGVTFGFDFSPQLRATIGYDFVYWNSVARPGDQIDLNLDPRQFPPPATTNATRPEFILHTSDYWAQGLNLGLDFRF